MGISIVTIDGLIGAGKSTIMKALHDRAPDKYVLDLEEVETWMPYLNELYVDNKCAFEFQLRVWLDRCWPYDKLLQPLKSEVLGGIKTLLVERAPLFQAKVFIDINEENGRISTREAALLREVYQKSYNSWQPNKMIYLRADPQKCLARIKLRHRPSEDAIPIQYLRRMYEIHEEISSTIPGIIVIDVEDKTPEEIADEIITKL